MSWGCGGCGQVTKGEFPDGVTAPVQYGPRLMGTGVYLWHGQFLSRDRACQALGELSGCAPSPGALAPAARKAARLVAPAVKAITAALARAEVAHFDESGFRAAGKLFWVHSARQPLDPRHRFSQARTTRPGGPGAGLRPAATAKSPVVARIGALP